MVYNDGTSLCYYIVVILAIITFVWGLMDLLKFQQSNESSLEQVISRQIRGAGLILVSQVILVFGSMLCFGASGGAAQLASGLRGLM
ncbi:hypothetical protein OAG24_00790 [bacterium]|nr:hypothetical protein [bacterium]